MTLTRIVHPFGRCCKATFEEPPRDFQTLINVRISSHEINGTINGLRLFLTDQNSASDFELNQLRVNGPSIECSNNQLLIYRAKVYEDIDLENDPQSSCRNYDEENSYHQCLENEYQEQVLDILGCSPPYIAQNTDLWCTKEKLSGKTSESEETQKFNSIAAGLWRGYIDKGACDLPCHTTSFRVVKSGANSRRGSHSNNVANEVAKPNIYISQQHCFDVLLLHEQLSDWWSQVCICVLLLLAGFNIRFLTWKQAINY